jgi:type 1 glutamine amidotransferase/HEAT repeat protein
MPTMLVGLLLAASAHAQPLRVLILSGANNHDWQQTTPALQQMLTESGRFSADVAEDPASLDAAMLAKYDLLLSNWNNWPSEDRVWGEKAEQAVLDFVRGGKGFALVHAASGCFGGWAEYQQLVGATWDKGATAHGAVHEFTVKIVDKGHAITRGSSDFTIRDELWHKMAVQPSAHILCTAFSAPETGGTGNDEPVVLTTSLGKGRGFYSILGHDATSMENLDWRLLMLRGCEWAATGRATITCPIDADLALAAIPQYERHQNRDAIRTVEKLVQFCAPNPQLREQLAPKLVALLGSPEATDDCRAFLLQQLSLIGSGREVPAIAAFLSNEKLRDFAIGALQRIPGKEAEAALVAALSDLKPPTQIGAINALGERRSARATDPLIALLHGGDEAAVLAAIDALGRIAGARATKALTSLPESRWSAAADALLSCADRLVVEGDPRSAAALYARLATDAYAEPVRTAACAGQVRCLKAGQADAVLEGLCGPDAARRAGAARALRELRDSGLASDAAARLPALPPEAQVPALNALYDVADASAIPALLPLVASPEPAVRAAAVRVVGRLGDASVWPALLDALRTAPSDGDRPAIEAALARIGGRILGAGGALPLDLAAEPVPVRTSLLHTLGRIAHPKALELAASQIGDGAVSRDACLAAVQIAEQLPVDQKPAIQAALEKVLAASRDDERTRTRARTILLGLGIPVEVTRSVALQDPGPNLALGAIASSPDDIDSDGAASGDQAGIDGDPATYWDEVNDQALYRFKVTFPAPTQVAAIRIMGHQQHMHSPKDFDILCDDRVVLSVEDAWYESNQFGVTFPPTTCTTLELKITGGYGPSPAIRELEIFGRP